MRRSMFSVRQELISLTITWLNMSLPKCNRAEWNLASAVGYCHADNLVEGEGGLPCYDWWDRKRVEKHRPVATGTCLAGAQAPGKGTVPWFAGRVGRRLLTPTCFRTCEANYFVHPLKSEIHTKVFVESVATSRKTPHVSITETNRLMLLTVRVTQSSQCWATCRRYCVAVLLTDVD